MDVLRARRLFEALVIGWFGLLLAAAAKSEEVLHLETDEFQQSLATVQEFVQQHCLDCHADNADRLDLQELEFTSSAFANAKFDGKPWELALRRVASHQMPPPDASRPSEDEYEAAIEAWQRILKARSLVFLNPGRTDSLRRLTRTEYQDSIRDLLSVQIDAEELLPPDESSHGFDNVTVGELSPTLLTRYLTAAQKISEVALGRPRRAIGRTIRLPADRTQEKHVDGLPLGTRGGTLFTHEFPAAGEYEIELRLTRDRDEKVEGLNAQHDIDVLIDRHRMHRFSVSPPPNKKDFTHSDTHLKTRIRVTGGPHQVGVTFPSKSVSLMEIKRQPFDARYNRHRHPRNTPALFQVSILGPLESSDVGEGSSSTPSRRRILKSLPSEGRDIDEVAVEVLRPIMRRAYRRPIMEADMESPMWFFHEGNREAGFEAGIETALTSILVNPNFLFRIESDPDGIESGTPYPVSDFELASRLSFFLWSSLPDETLLELADQGRLQEEEVLREQAMRMLRDDRASTLVSNFAAQWLYLRNLDSITPDLRLFPDFDDNLRQSFRRETELLFADVIEKDRSILKLIQTDIAFLNERLAVHYGIPGVRGSQFRPVDLTDPGFSASESQAANRRGGLLRQGSILTVTSYATRTSRTIRGN
ncbi:MAG: DUF1592 domain-containing protein, partial [Rubripirellula sp.]